MATILFDAEVFPHNWMFGFKILETDTIVQIWDDHDAIKQFMTKHKSDFFIGFNSNFYDDVILHTVLKGEDPYPVSVALIDRRERIRSYLRFNRMDLAEGVMNGMGLKALESEMGMSIEESDINFHIDRKLTTKEIEETNYYNKHDLDATHRLLGYRWTSFVKTKMDVIKYFNLPASSMNKTLATMIATGLGAKRNNHPPRPFKWYDTLQVEHEQVRDFLINQKFKTENLVFDLGGVEHTMGLGGIHAARPTYHAEKFWLIDVKGYYSLIQINYDLLSRSLPASGKAKYSTMYYDRLDLQAAGDPSALSLKLGILAVWGATLNKYQLLYDSDTGDLIMVTGQAFLIDLIEKLLPYATLIQSNTDGIMIIPHDEEKVMEEVNKWVERTTFEVTIDKGEKLYQKDVNNYVCMLEGKPEAKGGYVVKYDTHDNQRAFEMNLIKYQSQGAVIDKAVVNYFLYDIPVEDTVYNETDPRRFMYTIKKGGRTFSHVEMHRTNKQTNETEISTINNVNRIFISKDDEYDTRVFKIKDGEPHIFPRLNTNIFVFNGDLSEFTEEHMDMIDREHYIEQALSRIEDYITPEGSSNVGSANAKISLRMWKEHKTSVPNKALLVEKILSMGNNDTMRVGDLMISRMNDFYTFITANGKITVMDNTSINEDVFNVRLGKLNERRIVVQRAKKYVYVIERDYDALIRYEDKTNANENFEIAVESYTIAFDFLLEVGMITEDDVAKINPEEREVPELPEVRREKIDVDDSSYIMYEQNEDDTWVIVWNNRGRIIKQELTDDEDSALDIAEQWLTDHYK